jgi:hypothetical protein
MDRIDGEFPQQRLCLLSIDPNKLDVEVARDYGYRLQLHSMRQVTRMLGASLYDAAWWNLRLLVTSREVKGQGIGNRE